MLSFCRLLFSPKLCKHCASLRLIGRPQWRDYLRRRLTSFLFAAATVSSIPNSTNEKGLWGESTNRVKIEQPDPNTLTDAYLIKTSAVATVDSICTLLSQTVQAIITTENEYVKEVEKLIALKELQLQSKGDQATDDKVWDAILEVRAKVNKHKQNRENLALLLSYVEKMLAEAAEVAYMSGAEYSSISANEKLYSAKTYLEQTKQSSSDTDRKLVEMEAKIIEVVSEKAQEQSQIPSDTQP